MKKMIVFLLANALMLACKSPAVVRTSEVGFVSNPNPGQVRVEATGYGNSDEDAIANMYQTAFNTLFFQGLPAFTALRTPMIADEAKTRAENPAYFASFYAQNRYAKFITDMGETVKPKKTGQGKQRVARHTFTIHYEALRKDLEQNKIIRKFGY